MLAVQDSREILDTDTHLIAKNESRGTSIVWHPTDSESDMPLQRVLGNAWQLVDSEQFHKLTKRWNLNKKEVAIIRKFYSSGHDEELQLDPSTDSYRMRSAFESLERLLMKRLKREFKTMPGQTIVPHFEQKLSLRLALELVQIMILILS